MSANLIIYIVLSFLLGCFVTFAICLIKISELKAKLSANEQYKTNEDKLIEIIKTEFTSSANEILIQKQKSLQEENKISLEGVLNPLKERIKEFQEKVENADKNGKTNAETIKSQIEILVTQNQKTINETEKLSNALTQNSKFRGSLGELVLDKLLKSSGLIDKKDNPQKGNYETQVGFKDANGGEGTKIVDAIVYLSDGQKSIVIDSKTPLTNFVNYTGAENEEDKEKYMKVFMDDAKNRVKELSNKYTNLEGLNTPDFTIMFVPFEAPLTYIYSNNKLVEEAIKQNVIIAGPSTLIATLRAISYSWAQKNQYENIKDITKLGISIYDKLIVFIEKLEGIQKSFGTLHNKFEDAFKTISSKGGLVGLVEKLKDFGLTPAKDIDKKYLEDDVTALISSTEEN